MGVSQTQTPIFIDFTTTTSTSTVKTVVTVNTSNVGAGASGFTVGHSTPPVSPFCLDDPDTFYGDDGDEDFAGFTYSPLNIRTTSDEKAPITKGQLKAINEKLDSLLQASKASSTDDYSQASIRSIL